MPSDKDKDETMKDSKEGDSVESTEEVKEKGKEKGKKKGLRRVTMPPQMRKDFADLGKNKNKKLFLPDGTEVKKCPEGGTLEVNEFNAKRLKASGWS